MNKAASYDSLMSEFRRRSLEFETRRHFLQGCTTGLGALWLGTRGGILSAAADSYNTTPLRDSSHPLAPRPPHFAAKAKRVIWLHMAGSPSQLELFEHKPALTKLDGQDCPQSLLEGKRFAFIRGTPKLMGGVHPFHQEKKTGIWLSDRLPHLERVFDRLCVIHSMTTDQFNHAPAQLLMHTGSPNFGGACAGAWATYGLGSACENLPGFIVLLSGGRMVDAGKSVWSSGFLPAVHEGVQCRSEGEPVLYLANPPGIDRPLRGAVVNAINALNQQTYAQVGDPETLARIAQYEMAFRMQASASDAFDIAQEPPEVHALYGTEPGRESFANNCLLARRLVERGVRFVQLFDWGWDSHGGGESEGLKEGFVRKCQSMDRPAAALLEDLQRRGLLDDTLVIWGGEFGRTPMRENRGGRQSLFAGRDHHPGAFTMWLAGSGIKPGYEYGRTDDIGYDIVENPVAVQDFHATLLHQLGVDHTKLSYPVPGGLQQRLTTVTKIAKVVRDILS
ncbi:MAG: DUF1501 domain-containing protein [Pedosphaera sp.]|nr:DUF1501 domain-containing protein [Pedosphaera sp.]